MIQWVLVVYMPLKLSLPKDSWYPLKFISHLSTAPGNYCSAFCHHSLDYILCKWNHTDCTLQCVTSFTQHYDFEIRSDLVYQQFNIRYHWVVFHCMARPYFVYHSPVDGYLGCFQFLTIMNKVYEYSCTSLCGSICFHFCGVNT